MLVEEKALKNVFRIILAQQLTLKYFFIFYRHIFKEQFAHVSLFKSAQNDRNCLYNVDDGGFSIFFLQNMVYFAFATLE